MSIKHQMPRQDRRGKGTSPVMRHNGVPCVGTERHGGTAPGGNSAEPLYVGGVAPGDDQVKFETQAGR